MSAAGRHARPRARVLRWYLLPLPLALLLVLLMPWVAVRDVRRSSSAFRTLCDVLLIASRQRRELEERLGIADPVPRPRHLHAVK